MTSMATGLQSADGLSPPTISVHLVTVSSRDTVFAQDWRSQQIKMQDSLLHLNFR